MPSEAEDIPDFTANGYPPSTVNGAETAPPVSIETMRTLSPHCAHWPKCGRVQLMLLPIMLGIALASDGPSAEDCPRQAEPAALSSAAFGVPNSGDTLLFSSAPSFQRIRYALRVVKPTRATVATASLVRLQRRVDCNVHDRAGVWKFDLSTDETEALFAAAVALEQLDQNPSEIVLDGTRVELERYSSGQKAFTYSSNGLAKERLSTVVLEILKLHVPRSDLPGSADWRYRMPGSSL